jgi:NAD(P)-dependent dehydrogenase (short-subunit alcohol dehydrogenase family)
MKNKQLPLTNTVVVTGASSGIGKACALRLDKLGLRVFAGVRREMDSDTLRHEASARLTPILLDITDAASITSAVDTVTAALGEIGETGLAGIINNAGIAVAGPLEFLPTSELRKQLEVNVIGQIAVTQAFLPLLRQGQGRIVNIGSLGGRIAMPFLGPYNAAKFAMEALTDALRMELRPWHIHVSIIEPGFIATPIWEKSKEAADANFNNVPSQANDMYGAIIPTARAMYSRAGRTGTPAEEVVKVIIKALTAARPKTRYIVGRGARLGTSVLERLPDKLRDTLITWWLTNGV